jgi:L-amino acid N-acyltransferase YncA
LVDFHDEGSMYRYTFDLEIYVHHEYLRQGIGSCLIDHMLSLADPMYVSRGGYEYGKAPTGHGKVVKKINFGYRYDADKTDKAELVCEVFKNFKFRKAGHLKGVGVKLKHW